MPGPYSNPRLRASVILVNEFRRILVMQHIREHAVYWVLPGGGVDIGESVEDAGVREIREELGVDCDIERVVAVGELITPERHVVDFYILGKLLSNDDFEIFHDEGIGEVKWIDRDSIEGLELLPPDVKSLLIEIMGTGNPETRGVIYLGRYGG